MNIADRTLGLYVDHEYVHTAKELLCDIINQIERNAKADGLETADIHEGVECSLIKIVLDALDEQGYWLSYNKLSSDAFTQIFLDKETQITFSYESINDALYKKHPNLSGYWTSLGWNDSYATVVFMCEDGSCEQVYVFKDGSVSVSDKLLGEMEDI